jgi:hypothetical protein
MYQHHRLSLGGAVGLGGGAFFLFIWLTAAHASTLPLCAEMRMKISQQQVQCFSLLFERKTFHFPPTSNGLRGNKVLRAVDQGLRNTKFVKELGAGWVLCQR